MSQPSDSAPVQVEDRDGIRLVVLNRPEKRNAVDRATALGIAAAMDEFDANPALRVAVITGAGGYFCAGADLTAVASGELPVLEGRGFAGIAWRPPIKPVIAAVEGFALAGGFEIALACDLIVASTDSRFGLPEVKRGLVAAGGGLLRLPVRIPYHAAMEIVLTGEPISATRAYELGLITRLSGPGDALETALQLARIVLANGPLAVQTSKRIVTDSLGWQPDQAFERQEELAAPLRSGPEAREGAAAFLARRPPVWP